MQHKILLEWFYGGLRTSPRLPIFNIFKGPDNSPRVDKIGAKCDLLMKIPRIFRPQALQDNG